MGDAYRKYVQSCVELTTEAIAPELWLATEMNKLLADAIGVCQEVKEARGQKRARVEGPSRGVTGSAAGPLFLIFLVTRSLFLIPRSFMTLTDAVASLAHLAKTTADRDLDPASFQAFECDFSAKTTHIQTLAQLFVR